MNPSKSILSELEKTIIPLKGLKKLKTDNDINLGFNSLQQAFPNCTFPIDCAHEFITCAQEDKAATAGFVLSLLSKLTVTGGVLVFISTSQNVFAATLGAFNINPAQVIHIVLKKERDVLYAMEETLKCKQVTAVVADIKNISFKESRRFQLAAEESRVTGFIVRQQTKALNTIASVSRWRITSLPSGLNNQMPGVGFPRWKVELTKIRSGKPGGWIIE